MKCPTCGADVAAPKKKRMCSCGKPWKKGMVHMQGACWTEKGS